MRTRLWRWRLAIVLAIALMAGAIAYLATRPAVLPWSVEGAPEEAQNSAAAALTAAGYPPIGTPLWAAAAPGWHAPGRYRLFFAAAAPGGEADIYSADFSVNARGLPDAQPQVAHVTDTSAGAEDPPLASGRWLAFATNVAGRYQSLTALSLDDLGHPRVFALNQPPERVELTWHGEPGGSANGVRGATAALSVRLPGAMGERTFTLDPGTGRVLPDDSLITYIPAAQGEQAFLPNLVSRVRELPGVGPEKIAFLENVFFTAEDRVTRWWHSLAGSDRVEVSTRVLPTIPAASGAATEVCPDGCGPAEAPALPEAPARAGAAGVEAAGTAGSASTSPSAALPSAVEAALPAPAASEEHTGPASGANAQGAAVTGGPTVESTSPAAPGTASPSPVATSPSPTTSAPSGTLAGMKGGTASGAGTATSQPAAARAASGGITAATSVGAGQATPADPGAPLAYGITRRPTVRPDAQRPYAEVELLDIDPSLLQIKMVPGTWEPRPTTGLVGTGVIPVADRGSLVAAFNGGFAAMHGAFGMMVDRKVYLPARTGIATLAVYEDGSIRMGTWGTDIVQTPNMISYRQNCPPLIENGTITAETGKMTLWGLSVANEVYLYRSGLGVTAEGRLVYAAGRHLSAYTLARALQAAGVIYAMQLDVDEYHVAFMTYDVKPAGQPGGEPAVTGQKLRDDMRGFDGLFLRPFQLDFFYLLKRPEVLTNAVRGMEERRSGGVQGSGSAPASMPDLPGQLAFASNRDGNWELYAMQPGKAETLRRLTDDPADDLYPAWAPDATRLAFTSRRGGDADIYTLSLAGLDVTRVTSLPSEEWNPAWSPDGVRIAYQSDRNGQSDVYAAGPDGSGEARLTPWEANHEAPHWSPDGKQLVIDSDVDVSEAVHASINLYIISAETIGAAPRHIADQGESPAWSPDGKRIAYTGIRGGRWQVLMVNRDGTGYRQLTLGAYDARYPAWSPDGRWLAFAANKEGHWEIYVVPADGPMQQGAATYPVRLTYGSADNSYPAWGK